jgi:hypothetical protein
MRTNRRLWVPRSFSRGIAPQKTTCITYTCHCIGISHGYASDPARWLLHIACMRPSVQLRSMFACSVCSLDHP